MRGCAISGPMDRAAAIARLRRHEPELKAAGIERLSLFGSTARGDFSADSDVDLAAVLAPDVEQASGLAYFGRLEDLRERLAAILGRPVDLVTEPARRPALQEAIERDRLRAF